jgi:hypothetical protein
VGSNVKLLPTSSRYEFVRVRVSRFEFWNQIVEVKKCKMNTNRNEFMLALRPFRLRFVRKSGRYPTFFEQDKRIHRMNGECFS